MFQMFAHLYSYITEDDINWKGVPPTSDCPGSLGLKSPPVRERQNAAIEDMTEDREIDMRCQSSSKKKMIKNLVKLTNKENQTCVDLFGGDCAFMTPDIGRNDTPACTHSVAIKGAAKNMHEFSGANMFGEDCAFLIREDGILKAAVILDGHGGPSVSHAVPLERDRFLSLHVILENVESPTERQRAAENMYKELNASILEQHESGSTMVALFFTKMLQLAPIYIKWDT